MVTINTYLEKIPSWVRWIIFIPISILFYYVIPFIVLISSIMFVDIIWIYLFNHFISAYVLIFISALIVPKFKFFISLVMSVMVVIISSFGILMILAGISMMSHPLWVEIIARLLSIVASIVITLYIHKYEKDLEETTQ